MSLLLRYSSAQVKTLDLKCCDGSNCTSTCCDLSCKMVSILESDSLVLITTNCFDLFCVGIVTSGLEISSLIPNFSKNVTLPFTLSREKEGQKSSNYEKQNGDY